MPSWGGGWSENAKETSNEYPVMQGLRVYGLEPLLRDGRLPLLLG